MNPVACAVGVDDAGDRRRNVMAYVLCIYSDCSFGAEGAHSDVGTPCDACPQEVVGRVQAVAFMNTYDAARRNGALPGPSATVKPPT